jgi:hypothetical protein
MEHRSAHELRGIAEVSAHPPAPLGRRERLQRWAHLLELASDARINLIHELEFAPRAAQQSMRADGSALSIAFNDPVLRAEGLSGDTIADGQAFFSITDRDTHRLLCSCMHGLSMRARDAAWIVRSIANPIPGIIARTALIAGACAAPALMLLMG